MCGVKRRCYYRCACSKMLDDPDDDSILFILDIMLNIIFGV